MCASQGTFLGPAGPQARPKQRSVIGPSGVRAQETVFQKAPRVTPPCSNARGPGARREAVRVSHSSVTQNTLEQEANAGLGNAVPSQPAGTQRTTV